MCGDPPCAKIPPCAKMLCGDVPTARLGAEETTICWRPERAYYYMSQGSIEANPVCIFWVRPPEDPFTSYGVPRSNNSNVDESPAGADLVNIPSNNGEPKFTLSPLAADQPDRANWVKIFSPVRLSPVRSTRTKMINNLDEKQLGDDKQLALSTGTSAGFEIQCFPQNWVRSYVEDGSHQWSPVWNLPTPLPPADGFKRATIRRSRFWRVSSRWLRRKEYSLR